MATYLPGKNSTIMGTHSIGGFMDGVFINIEPASDTWKKKVGGQGTVARVRIEDESFRVTLTLMSSSPSNKVLSGLFKTDKATGKGQLPFAFEDASSGDTFFATNSWIVAQPALGKGDDITPVVWIIDCEKGDLLIAGTE